MRGKIGEIRQKTVVLNYLKRRGFREEKERKRGEKIR